MAETLRPIHRKIDALLEAFGRWGVPPEARVMAEEIRHDIDQIGRALDLVGEHKGTHSPRPRGKPRRTVQATDANKRTGPRLIEAKATEIPPDNWAEMLGKVYVEAARRHKTRQD